MEKDIPKIIKINIKEDNNFELSINEKPNMMLTKEYWFPCDLDLVVEDKKLTFQEYVKYYSGKLK